MAQVFSIHPRDPQPRLVARAADVLRGNGLIVYPTDSSYALGALMDAPEAHDRARRVRGLDERHFLTLVCRDLSALSTYARVENPVYRLLKAHTPGPYTFVLKATRDVPRRLQHPKRRTVGIRVPDHPVARALLEAVGEPIMSTTLRVNDDTLPLNDADAIVERVGRQVDAVIDAGPCGVEPTTIVDFSSGLPEVVREGLGDVAAFRQVA